MVLRNILYGFILSFSSHSAKPFNFINFLRPAQKATQHDPSRSEEETEEQVLEDGEEALDLGLGAEAGLLYNGTPIVTVISPQQLRTIPPTESKLIRRDGLAREPSVQSDVTSHGSHGSSVESYLESRKPDPEEVLLSLGFGGPVSLDSEVTRIPRRFLQPSKVKGVAIKDFLRHQQELIENFETGFCGYRGLTPGLGHDPLNTHIVSSASSPIRTFSSMSPIFNDSFVNIPMRFLPQPPLGQQTLLSVPGQSQNTMVRSMSTKRHLSVRVNPNRRASEPAPPKIT